MRKKDPRTKCIKRKLTKCKEVFRAYDDVQNAYADKLENDPDVVEFECNVPFDDEEFKDYATDFVITKSNDEIAIRECAYRKSILKPKTVSLLDFSQRYWLKKGITDWKVVINA